MSDYCVRLVTNEERARTIARTIEPPLEELGASTALFEVDEDASIWEVCAYATTEDLPTIEALLREAGTGLDVEIAKLPDTDWVTASLAGLGAVVAGGFVVHGGHEPDAARRARTAIRIDAGQAFGTGHHGTTAGCLIAIDRILRRGRPAAALDLGTGSGVLAIGLARRARVPVVATDIDPVATRVARENAALNYVAPHIRIVRADGLHDPSLAGAGRFDLVIANILAGPLIKLAGPIARALAPGGRVVLSGLLLRQQRAVLAAYRAHRLVPETRVHREGWATLTLRRPGRT